jgi:PKD repeat protein
VFLTTNNGNNWIAVNNGLSKYTGYILSLAISGDTIYAGTCGYGVWKRSLSNIITTNCSAQFSIVPDTLTLHHYYIVNNAFGIPPLTYLWSWGDGTYDSIAYPSHTYSTAGYYNICLTITDTTGCTSTYCDSSYIQKATNDIIFVEVISPDVVGINVNELSERIKIYPNPTSDKLTIETKSGIAQSYVLSVKNIQGQEVLSKKINFANSYSIDVSDLSNGIYILSLQNEKENFVKKIIIQK